jgi:hypothetical protein
VILLLLVIVALLIVIGAGSSNASLQVARVSVIFLSFLVFSDLMTQALAWWEASQKSNDVYHRLDSELGEIATALAVFGDYSVATATTPPIRGEDALPFVVWKLAQGLRGGGCNHRVPRGQFRRQLRTPRAAQLR